MNWHLHNCYILLVYLSALMGNFSNFVRLYISLYRTFYLKVSTKERQLIALRNLCTAEIYFVASVIIVDLE